MTPNSGTSHSAIPVTPTGLSPTMTQNSGTSHSTIPVTPTGLSPTMTQNSDTSHSTIPVTPTGLSPTMTQNSGTSHSTIPVTPTGLSPTMTQNSGTSHSAIPVTPTGLSPTMTQNSGTSHSTIPVTPTGLSPTMTQNSDIQLGSNIELSTSVSDLQIASESTDIEVSSSLNEEFIQMEDFTWNECNQNSNRLVIRNVNISPDPVLRGHDMKMKFTLIVPNTITSGSVELKLWKKIGPILWSLHDRKLALSKKFHLPLATGNDEFVFTKAIPRLAPLGSYYAKLILLDQNNNKGCIDINFSIA